MLAFGEEEFLDALAMTGPEAFFNKLLTDNDVMQARSYATGPDFDRPVPIHMSGPSPALVLSPIRSANRPSGAQETALAMLLLWNVQ